MSKEEESSSSFLRACYTTINPWIYQNREEYWQNKGKKHDGDLQVIGAGYGRTGTSSMQQALEILYGSACYHGYDDILRDDFEFWSQASRGEKVNYRDVFEGYCATVDWPACRCWKEIADTYPNAKIVLTVREVA